MAVDPTKVQSVTEWLAPTSVSEIRSFLGLAGYYQRFIENFSKIAKPMTELLKNGTNAPLSVAAGAALTARAQVEG